MSGTEPLARPRPSYGVVVPVKPTRVAKSRLAALGGEVRRELVTAFALDTVTAASECASVRGVLVVTDDSDLGRAVRELGLAAIPDGSSGDLNASLVQGAAELVRRFPGVAPVALCGDLPCLRADELREVLDGVPARPAFVPDAAATGTTLYAAADLDGFSPLFGADSGARHRAAGATELTDAGPSVRRDVDTPADLQAALALGVGSRTSYVVTRHRL